MFKKIIPIIIAVFIITGAVGFFAGMQYGQNKNQTNFNGPNNFVNLSPEERQLKMQDFGGGQATGDRVTRTGVNFVTGEILSKDDESLTIKLFDGGSKIIFLSSSTEINKMATGTLDELIVGANIMAQGQTNTDGSITAASIQLRPSAPTIPAN